MSRYVVSKNEDGSFTGFCLKSEFDKHPELFAFPGETTEEFDGPDPDGENETFEQIRRLALALCQPEEA